MRDEGRSGYAEFATDSCSSLFGRFFTPFRPRRPATNSNVNLPKFDDSTVAMTEVPLAVEFDPETLDTLGILPYRDELGGHLTTAHPHAEPATGDLINYALRFGRRSEYRFYR